MILPRRAQVSAPAREASDGPISPRRRALRTLPSEVRGRSGRNSTYSGVFCLVTPVEAKWARIESSVGVVSGRGTMTAQIFSP